MTHCNDLPGNAILASLVAMLLAFGTGACTVLFSSADGASDGGGGDAGPGGPGGLLCNVSNATDCLTDDFESAELDEQWAFVKSPPNSAPPGKFDGKLYFPVSPNSAEGNDKASYTTRSEYGMRGGTLLIEIVSLPQDSRVAPFMAIIQQIDVGAPALSWVMGCLGNDLYTFTETNGVKDEEELYTGVCASAQWWRFEQRDNNVFFAISVNGLAWDNYGSLPLGETLDMPFAVTIGVATQQNLTGALPAPFVIDNVNLPPSPSGQ